MSETDYTRIGVAATDNRSAAVHNGNPLLYSFFCLLNAMTHETNIRYGSPTFLRLALGFVYFHFGLLKFFPDLSPAELIGTQTVMAVSLRFLDAHTSLVYLAVLECAIGIGLIFNLVPRLTFLLFLLHMAGTFMPLFVLPEFTFKFAPFAPNMEGQYIFKNLVFVAAGWTVLRPHIFTRARSVVKSSTEAVPQPARN